MVLERHLLMEGGRQRRREAEVVKGNQTERNNERRQTVSGCTLELELTTPRSITGECSPLVSLATHVTCPTNGKTQTPSTRTRTTNRRGGGESVRMSDTWYVEHEEERQREAERGNEDAREATNENVTGRISEKWVSLGSDVLKQLGAKRDRNGVS